MPTRVADLLQTKLRRPGVTRDLVPRPRLVERLDRALSVPLTLVCAPAGFGKTTLVSSWIEGLAAGRQGEARGEVTQPVPCAWLSLDEADGDLVRFLRYFTVALRSIYPDACAETLSLLAAPRQPPQELLATSISNEIALLPGPFVLVLDDYYAVHGKAVHALLGGLVRQWLQPMHLVLVSRLNPPLPLAALRAKGMINEIRTRDLRFTRDETAAFLGRVLPSPLSEPAAALLEQHVEGWVAGLRLATLSLQAADNAESVLAALSGSDANIAGYLMDEVLARQPTQIQGFLLRTSILERFCAPLCEAVAAGDDPLCDASACMAWVERADLFLVPLDNRGEWYRYHALFRDLLQQRLLTWLGRDEAADLHRRAAGWLAGHGLVDEALRHALAAGDLHLAAGLVEQGLQDVLNREDRTVLERRLRLLPDEVVQSRPGLLVARAWASVLSWRLPAVAATLERVEELVGKGDGAPGDRALLSGQLALLRAQQAYYRNRIAEALAGCRAALALLPPSWTYVRGVAMLYLGTSMRAEGQGEAAERLLLEQYEALADKTDSYALRLLLAVCHTTVEAGRLAQTWQTAHLMLEQADHSGLVVMQGWAHFFLGLVYYWRNELEGAVRHFGEVTGKRYLINAHTARNGMIGLALAQMARGDVGSARRTAELLTEFDLTGLGYEPDDAASLRARLHLAEGDLESAARWADAFGAPVADQPPPWLVDPPLVKCRILLATGAEVDARAALSTLDALDEIAARTFNTRSRIETQSMRALALDAVGRSGEARAALRQALELARPGGFVQAFVDLGPRVRDMLVPLAGQGLTALACRRILSAFPVPPSAAPSAGAQSSMVGGRSSIVHGESSLLGPLTPREIDVLILLRERLSNKEIAQRLGLSTATVKRHLVNIYGKLGVNKRMHALIRAEALGFLPPR